MLTIFLHLIGIPLYWLTDWRWGRNTIGLWKETWVLGDLDCVCLWEMSWVNVWTYKLKLTIAIKIYKLFIYNKKLISFNSSRPRCVFFRTESVFLVRYTAVSTFSELRLVSSARAMLRNLLKSLTALYIFRTLTLWSIVREQARGLCVRATLAYPESSPSLC